MILDELNDKLKKSMKAGDKITVLSIRNILEKIKNERVNNKCELNESQIINLINKYAKQLKDSIQQFKEGGRLDLVEKENKELQIIEKFLPEQMSEEEINKVVSETIEELNANNMSDMGKVMAQVLEKTQGGADGKIVSVIVREKLQK